MSTNDISDSDNALSDTDSLSKTRWRAVMLLFAAGCTTALNIGKVPSALPLLRADWQLSLTQAGFILSIYAVLIATGGLMLGILVQRFSYPGFAIVGVGVVGLGSVLGAQADMFYLLLATRAMEGLGWIMAVISLPPLLTALTHPQDRPLVLGIWGSFVPVGAGLMLLLSPALLSWGGWRFSWLVAGFMSLMAAILIMVIVRHHARRFSTIPSTRPGASRRFTDLHHPLIWVLSTCFLLYSLLFVSITSFLPTLLLDTTSLSLATASRFTAVVIISNASGNIAAGYLLRRGMSHVPLLVVGALGMGVFAFVVFSDAAPIAARLVSAFGFAIFGGLIPGTCFATLPRAVSVVSATGLLIGLMMQSAGIGQLLGGVVVPVTVDYSGSWQAAGFVLLGLGIAGACLALFSRVEPSHKT